MRITLLDLGVGNIHSLGKAFARAAGSADVIVTGSIPDASLADLLVLPGVGAWGAVSWSEGDRRMLREALERGLACIGICLGMQLLFDSSEEAAGPGLGFFAGPVTKLRTPRLPHMGWSRIAASNADLEAPEAAYFAHSFACRPSDPSSVLATTTLEHDEFAVVVRRGHTVGCQFHPEKSSAAGISFLGRLIRSIARPS